MPVPTCATSSPTCPSSPGYNKRLRKAAGLMRSVNRILATTTSVWSDDVWVVDSTPVECGRSRETVKRSDLAGWAEYGYCASHSRFFWGAWDSRASPWTAERRQAYADDPGAEHSPATTTKSNRSKSAQDPAEWTSPTPAVRRARVGRRAGGRARSV
jgi:hypothetical protein